MDGFPRSSAQARFVMSRGLADVVLHITLERWVAIEKILGRRRCDSCGNDFNVAHVTGGGFDMPAILPSDASYRCPLVEQGLTCHPKFSVRSDDNPESVAKRLESYDRETTQAVAYFEEHLQRSGSGLKLHHFEVRKGIQDVDALAELIRS